MVLTLTLKIKKMRKIILMVILTPVLAYGQDIKVESGVTFGKLNYDIGDNTYYKNIAIGYYATVGIDYLKKRRFNISSNIGFLQKVGSDVAIFSDALGNETYSTKTALRFNYLTVNTFTECNFAAKGIIPFAFGGPRLDYAINSNHVDFNERLAFGVTLGAGAKYSSGRLLLGLRIEYLLNFNKILNTDDRTFSSTLMFGYKLK